MNSRCSSVLTGLLWATLSCCVPLTDAVLHFPSYLSDRVSLNLALCSFLLSSLASALIPLCVLHWESQPLFVLMAMKYVSSALSFAKVCSSVSSWLWANEWNHGVLVLEGNLAVTWPNLGTHPHLTPHDSSLLLSRGSPFHCWPALAAVLHPTSFPSSVILSKLLASG